MTHILSSAKYRIKAIVRYKKVCWESQIVCWNNSTKTLMDYLKRINSDILKYVDDAEDNFMLSSDYGTDGNVNIHPIDNVEMMVNDDYKRTITPRLVFASHPDVINWVSITNPSHFDIINIPLNYKIIVKDIDISHTPVGYEYILVPSAVTFQFL